MKHNEFTKELLTINTNIFESLHIIFGYDFEKDFIIEKYQGKFTYNQLTKAMGKHNFIVLFSSNASYYSSKLTLAEVKNGGFDFEFSTGSVLNNPYTKGNFEELRKNAKDVYCIYQSEENRAKATYLTNCNGKPMDYAEAEAEANERFFVKNREYWQNNRKLSRSYKLHLELDKSGFNVRTKREELTRKARNLRPERSKAQAEKMNLDSLISEMQSAYNNKKNLLVAMIQDNHFRDLSVSSLEWAKIELDEFKTAYESKCFSSVESIETKKNRFYNYIGRVVRV